MTIEDVIKTYNAEVGAADGRHEREMERDQQTHDQAVADADRVRDKAVKAAAARLEKYKAEHEVAHARALTNAEEKFDASARIAVGAPDTTWLDYVGTRIELWIEGATAPIASASDHGGQAGWALDGPEGRTFHGPSGRNQARAGLWQIAASLPRPRRQPVAS